MEWDSRLAQTKGKPNLSRLIFPVRVSEILIARGYDRVKIIVTPEGMLLKPYVSKNKDNDRLAPVELPEWK